ncbi:malonic semialdehyde reductase [Azoarcus sp. TTM-91]|uniref:malonic semialdehyde reductase n=1 Tax=Azoarcus sp. TTM-91 TaxID=2691581 RepID=UPI00145ED580|nr:malonic semialdehyde reductase [Azoarcus sp. TTM-91]NMG35624.1 malonic semialdehyde reductase [Azoarcus sp. TTM-91]
MSANDAALDLIFRTARSFNRFTDQPVSDDTLRQLYELLKWGPTSMNCQPARYVFVKSAEAKARLKPGLAPGNADKTMAAPVTVIVAQDPRFYEQLPAQFPAVPGARDMFAGNAALADATAFRNSSLQAAYLIVAARALGLDCGPMSGFDAAKVDAEFFPGGEFKSNMLINLGYGDAAGNYPRGPRLGFDEVARIV